MSEQKRKREDLIPLLKKPEPTKKKTVNKYSKLSLNRKRQPNHRVGIQSEMIKKSKGNQSGSRK